MVAWAIPVAIAAGSAIAQWMNSSAAAKASAQEREYMKGLLSEVKSPNFDPSKLTPEQYKVAATYIPEVADFVAEVNPSLTKLDENSMAQQERGRATLEAASQDQLLSGVLAAKAQQAAAAQAQANSATLKQDYAQRGLGGGGLEFLDRLMAGQQGAQVAAKSTQDAELQAYQERMRNTVSALDAARSIGDQRYTANANNTGILNSFNQRTAARQQDWANTGANTRNDAQHFNIGNQQDVANKNTSTNNQFAQYNQNREDSNKQTKFENEMSKVRSAGGLSDAARSDRYKSAAQTNNAISGIADIGMTAWDKYEDGEKKKKS
jgi:hypothetical protein